MRIKDWSPKEITAKIEKKAMDRLEKAGNIVASKARQLVPVGKDRPLYKDGPAWTARMAGTLKKSIRVTRLPKDPKLNIRVYAGERRKEHLTAYYAHMIEFGTSKMSKKSFLRPALNQSRASIMNIMENG